MSAESEYLTNLEDLIRFRCDYCGRFISCADLNSQAAVRRMLTPDSEFTRETFETFHRSCQKDKP